MTLGRSDRWSVARTVALVAVILVVGLLHRRATPDAWADDSALTTEPAWMQVGAPLWHAALDQSASVASTLARLIDPLTRASTMGDVRAIAAAFAGLAAGTLLLVLRRARVPELMAILLSCSTVGLTLPISGPLSAAHTLQMLLGASLLLIWLAVHEERRRWLALSAITILGALNHSSFLAFAGVIWILELFVAGRGAAAIVIIAGATSLLSGVLLAAWMLHVNSAPPGALVMERPDTLATVIGLVTGRFSTALQPSQHLGLSRTTTLCLPGPLIVCAPLVVMAFLRRETRHIAVAAAAAAAALLLFTAGTWLPDPTVALAPARLAVIVVSGLGLSWVAAQPVRGATILALAASAGIGLGGFVSEPAARPPEDIAALQSFVEAAPAAIGESAWTADHLAVTRAVLRADHAAASAHVPLTAGTVSAAPEEHPVIAFGDAIPEITGAWAVPFDVAHPSAARFLAALPAHLWIAAALRGPAADGFCADLLTQLGADPAASSAPLAVLAAPADGHRRASIAAAGRLDADYGRTLEGSAERVPARFAIGAEPTLRVVVNDRVAAQADTGLAIVTFDPWTFDRQTWLSTSCDTPQFPVIADPRLAARLLVALNARLEPPRSPALISAPVRVDLGAGGANWLGAGWHGPEGDNQAFRWTSATEAHVNVAVAYRRPIRVRLNATLAATADDPNALGLEWNGTPVRPLGPWSEGPDGEWTVPASAVRRGMNVFTIRVAHTVTPAGDSRALGAVVQSLTFEPASPTPQ